MARSRVAKAWLGATSLLMLVGLAPNCAKSCPEGYRREHDVCVATLEVAAPHRCSVLKTIKQVPDGLLVRIDIPEGDCFWMDQTEVTVAAYEGWLNDRAASVTWKDSTWCEWKTTRSDPVADFTNHNATNPCTESIRATLDDDPFNPAKPMRCIDFCDADAYCRYANKRLCYGLGTKGLQDPRDVPQEWGIACTNGFKTVFPWGNDAGAADCNVSRVSGCSACSAFTVGKQEHCLNARGVADLLGNVAEWTFSCNFIQPDSASIPSGCMVKGGGFDQPLQPCSDENVLQNDSRLSDLGFRCCADLTTDEEQSIAQ